MSSFAELAKTNPQLQLLQTRFQHTLSLALEKAAAHLKEPQAYPLPSANKKSLERALYEVVKALPNRKQDKFLDKMKDALNVSSAQRKQKYGDLSTVNLKSNQIIAEQVKAIPVADALKISEADVKTFNGIFFPNKTKPGIKLPGLKKQPQQASVDGTKLDFIVDNLVCSKTNDIRKDEISLGAFATDAIGTGSDKAPFFVGKFKKGEAVALNGNANLFSFAIDDGSVGAEFPLTFTAGVFLIEADLVHNSELGVKLATALSVIGFTFVVVSLGLLFVPGGAPFALIGFFAATGLSILGHYIVPFMIDDFSLAAIDTLVLDAPPAIGETFNRSLQLNITPSIVPGSVHGSYTANARWVVS